jgi:hypothetical protein
MNYKPAKSASFVQPIHFEDFSGLQFERLVFAYHARTENWLSLEWYGQSGNDLGRDIWGVRDSDISANESVCIQCVNRKTFTFAKVKKDIGKILGADTGAPDVFRVVAASNVSAEMREKIKKYVKSLGVPECDVWSGSEFEEFLRHRTESLLKRFVEGEVFPDASADLMQLATTIEPISDEAALELFARIFNRPAFYTPMQQESNLGDFKQAVTDTIQALGTGIWRTRDGALIERISSRHQLRSEALRTKMQDVEKALTKLRAKFEEMIRTGTLYQCRCDNPNCPVYFFKPPREFEVLEQFRRDVLNKFRDAYPAFNPPLW